MIIHLKKNPNCCIKLAIHLIVNVFESRVKKHLKKGTNNL
jgi:hypothetical protein